MRAGVDDDGGLEKAAKLLERASLLADKCANPELQSEVAYENGENLVRMRRLREATQSYEIAERKFREVFDNLPEEFRESYKARFGIRLRNRKGSLALPAESSKKGSAREAKPAAAKSDARTRTSAPPAAEDSLRRVSMLMSRLRSEESLKSFLEALLDEILAVSGGDIASWLVVTGDDVRLEASRSVSKQGPGKAEDLLQLELIERVLTEKQPLVLTNTTDDTAVSELLGPQVEVIHSLAILPLSIAPELDGVLYLVNPSLAVEPTAAGPRQEEYHWQLQPFLNLVALAYLQLGREPVPRAGPSGQA